MTNLCLKTFFQYVFTHSRSILPMLRQKRLVRAPSAVPEVAAAPAEAVAVEDAAAEDAAAGDAAAADAAAAAAAAEKFAAKAEAAQECAAEVAAGAEAAKEKVRYHSEENKQRQINCSKMIVQTRALLRHSFKNNSDT